MIQKQVVRYLIGGSMSFSIEFFCFNLLFYAGMASVIISNSVSFCVGLTASLLINKLWVFRSDTSNDWSLWVYSKVWVDGLRSFLELPDYEKNNISVI